MKKDSQPPFSKQYYCDTEQEHIFAMIMALTTVDELEFEMKMSI
jgi:hypothetical protein